MTKEGRIYRLYMRHPLELGALVPLEAEAYHYLLHVLRLNAKDPLKVFNGYDGEWLAELEQINKKNAYVRLKTLLKPQLSLPILKLYIPPLRPSRMGFLLEKITEVGVTDVYPIQTDHTAFAWGKGDKSQKHMIEAAEQSERLCVPKLHQIQSLMDILRDLSSPLAWAYERCEGSQELKEQQVSGLLIGPEGGFSLREIKALQEHPFIHTFSLGPMILRSETAAIVGLHALSLNSKFEHKI
jgi:16S rRNA (uracil1498-N3)-methyltransferase